MSQNKNGFSLIELLITLGVMGAIMAGSTAIIQNQMRGTATIAANQDVTEFVHMINQAMATTDRCKILLNGATAKETTDTMETAGTLWDLKLKLTGNEDLDPNNPAKNKFGNLTVTKMIIKNKELIPNSIADYRAELKVEMLKPTNVMGTKISVKMIPIYFTQIGPPGNPTIDSCGGGDLGPQASCENIGGTWAGDICDVCPIVGMGTFNPISGQCERSCQPAAGTCANPGDIWSVTLCLCDNSNSACQPVPDTCNQSGDVWNTTTCQCDNSSSNDPPPFDPSCPYYGVHNGCTSCDPCNNYCATGLGPVAACPGNQQAWDYNQCGCI